MKILWVKYAGVPLSLVLEPTFFLAFVNDIDDVCKDNTTLQLFADHAKLCLSIYLRAHSISLQQSLDY
jgi:hypothetical protein